MKTRRLVSLAFLLGLGVALHYLEGLIPFDLIPGFRLGLSNIVSLFVLYYYGGPSFLFVTYCRVVLVGAISSGFASPSFLMSLSGAVLSSLLSLLLYYTSLTSIYGTSILSSLFHVLGQLLAYALFFSTFSIFSYVLFLGPLSLVTGALIALLCSILIKRLPSFFRLEEKKRRT